MKIKTIVSALLVLVALMSCDSDDTENVSTITYYPNLRLIDNAILYVEKGTEFTDPGIRATLNGLSIPYDVYGNVDTRVPAVYDLTYTAENSEGFTSSISRKVFVYENNGTLAGVWNGTRVGRTGGPVLIATTDTPGVYYTSGFLGGYYEYAADLGISYRCHGYLEINGDVITSTGGENIQGLWTLSDGIVLDHQQGMLWTVTYASSKLDLSFDVELIKVRF